MGRDDAVGMTHRLPGHVQRAFRQAVLGLVVVTLSTATEPNLLSDSEQDDGFMLLFDGESLAGWDGDPGLWSVSDGAIIGSSDGQAVDKNTYLIYQRPFADFVLRLEVRLRNGNSGIQFRSRHISGPGWIVHGYQADLSDAGERSAWGNFYEEKGRGRGVMATPDEGWQRAKGVVRSQDWNQYEIHAKGDRIRLTLNGKVTFEGSDDRSGSGVIAIQLHSGPGMQVECRSIRIKPL